MNSFLILVFWNSVDQSIFQHMIDTQAEFLMEVTDKLKSDVKVSYFIQFLFHLSH